jgi:hypothetical protein
MSTRRSNFLIKDPYEHETILEPSAAKGTKSSTFYIGLITLTTIVIVLAFIIYLYKTLSTSNTKFEPTQVFLADDKLKNFLQRVKPSFDEIYFPVVPVSAFDQRHQTINVPIYKMKEKDNFGSFVNTEELELNDYTKYFFNYEIGKFQKINTLGNKENYNMIKTDSELQIAYFENNKKQSIKIKLPQDYVWSSDATEPTTPCTGVTTQVPFILPKNRRLLLNHINTFIKLDNELRKDGAIAGFYKYMDYEATKFGRCINGKLVEESCSMDKLYIGNGNCHLLSPTTRQCLYNVNFKFSGGSYHQFMQCSDQPPDYFYAKDCPEPNQVFKSSLQRCVEDNLCANKANQNLQLPDYLRPKHQGEVYIQCIDGRMSFKNCASMFNGGKLLPNRLGCVDKNCTDNMNSIAVTNIINNMDCINFHTFPGAIVECRDGLEVNHIQNGEPNILEKTEAVFKHTKNDKWVPFSIKYYLPEFIYLPNGNKKLLKTFRDAPELFTQNKIRVVSFLTNEISFGAFIRLSLFINVDKNKNKSLDEDLEIETDPNTVHPCVLFDKEFHFLQNAKRHFGENILACSWINKTNMYQFDETTKQFNLSTNYLPLLDSKRGYYTNNLTKTTHTSHKTKVAIFLKTESMADSIKFLQYAAKTDLKNLNLNTLFGYIVSDRPKKPRNHNDKLNLDDFDTECKDIQGIELLLNVYNYNINSKKWCLKGKVVNEDQVPCSNVIGLKMDDYSRQLQTCTSFEVVKPSWYDQTKTAVNSSIKTPVYIKSYNVLFENNDSNKATIVSIDDYLKLTTANSNKNSNTRV